jgi:fructoselysine 6-kinase
MKILALGTSCVDVYPQKEVVVPGGEALNISAHLSFRGDVEVFLMGLIGTDVYASSILNCINKLDINSKHVYQVKGDTANHVIQIDKQGDRFFENGSWNGGVSADLVLGDMDTDLILSMDAVMTTLWEPNLSQLLVLKHPDKFIIAVDFNQQRDFSMWEAQIDKLDIFFSSADKSMRGIFHARSKQSKTIFVLTFGEHGSVAFYKGEVFECQAIKIEDVVDTTGCGDCYQAHFVAEYLKTGNIQASMKQATIAASIVTGYVGGFTS